MKTLRARLFLSVGSILLLIAILSYALPKFFIYKDISRSAQQMNHLFDSYRNKVQQLTDSLVSYRILQSAAQLYAVGRTLPKGTQNAWEFAASLISYSPSLAVVQVSDDKGQTAVISPESAKLFIPAWARDSQGRLWIKLSTGTLFATSKFDETTYLLLAQGEGMEQAKALTYTSFQKPPSSFSLQDAPQQIYQALQWKENVQLQEAQIIQILASHKETASGIMRVDHTFKQAGAILAQDIFSTTAVVNPAEHTQEPFILLRPEGPYVNLMQLIIRDNAPLVIGFSLSEIASEMALMLQKPILIYDKNKLLQAFDGSGLNLPLNQLTVSEKNTTLNGVVYLPDNVQIYGLTISILTPEALLQTVTRVLNKLRDTLINKISYILLGVAGVLLLVALMLLARISKKITNPIAMLAHASEEIGNGKYEGLHLPSAEKRHDEVAVLTHSFKKMVISLLEKEKVRGVLNKVVSKEIASKVLSGSIELGGEERVLTMLFSDIRGFTPLSATLSPRELISMLNSYMTRMCRIIDATHGVVDKFVGDEIMALYGAPLDLQNHGEKAIEAALWMINDLKKWNLERPNKAHQLAIGIGIHTGMAFSGNMGAENRLNYTVVGANVNLAARLCAAAQPMQILISEQTFLSLPNPQQYMYEKLPAISLKGISQPVDVYAIVGKAPVHQVDQ